LASPAGFEAASARRKSADSYWWQRREAKPICSVEKMRKTLKTALTADNPPSTKHLSRRLGYADDRLMRKRFPALCAGISANRRKWQASLPARIRPSIEKALLEDLPPSLIEIARQKGIGVATLKKYCPALKRKLAARQAAFRSARNAQQSSTGTGPHREPCRLFDSCCKAASGFKGSAPRPVS
jgi:hypothetical protein